MAGYGVKLWPIIQNIGQVQELYPENWETFLRQCRAVDGLRGERPDHGRIPVRAARQAHHLAEDARAAGLRVNLAERIDDAHALAERVRQAGAAGVLQGTANLRDARELGRTISRASGNLTVFTESGEAFLLRRTPYDKLFKRNRYSPDPLH